MSDFYVNNIFPTSGNPGDATPVNINGSKVKGSGIGLRAVCIGDNLKGIDPNAGPNADMIHIGVSVFPTTPGYNYNPQTVAIGSLIGDLSSANGSAQSVYIGTEIARNISGGYDNIIIGYKAGNVLTNLSSNNTIIGSQSGSLLTTGQWNTLIGKDAGNNLTTGGDNIVIGKGATAATATSINSITLGNSSASILRCAVTSITSLSDARDKKNIEESTYGLDFVDSLKPVKFEWDTRDGAKKDIKDLGFIAQDLKEVDDEYLGLVYSENPEKLEASYGRLIPVLVKAIQELSKEVKQLKTK